MNEDGMRASESNAPQKKPRKTKLIIAGVIAAVVVVAGIGGWVWHEQPSFCGTVCHNVMGSYVEGYESGEGNLLVSQHANLQYSCLDCHEPTLDEQVGELMTYVAGDYTIPLEDSGIGTRGFCMRAGCHDDWDAIVKATADWPGTKSVYNPDGIYNPHENHRGAANCGDCHKIHGQSELYCAECHNVKVPDGWLGYE